MQGFEKILEQMKGVVSDPKLRIEATGHVGAHWYHLRASLDDAEGTLKALEATVIRVNKSASILESMKKTYSPEGCGG